MIGNSTGLMILAALVVCSGFGPVELLAQTALGGAELESGCQVYADKAVKLSTEWEQLQCQKKLGISIQLFNTDRSFHYNRCKNSVGTSIAADLKSMEDQLKACRGSTGAPGNPGTREIPANHPGRPGAPPVDPETNPGDLWDILVINSADLARSDHTFRIPDTQGKFTALNTRPGGPKFSGQTTGAVFEAVMTDSSGYRARFIGHRAGPNRIEGTGWDNRERSFSFTMVRR